MKKSERKEAERLLKRYNYNLTYISDKYNEIAGVSAQNIDGMPKAPYSFSDSVFKQLMKIENDSTLQKSIKEYKIVEKALKLFDGKQKEFFEMLYGRQEKKEDVIYKLVISERTFVRRKSELISIVHKELKKMA